MVLLDERGDRVMQRGDAAVDAAAELPLGEQGEEALDLIEPGGAGRGMVDVPVRALEQPVAHGRGLVGGVVVHDEMDVDIGRDICLDRIEEAAELSRPVPGEAFADHSAGDDVECREQRGRAVPLVVV